MALNKNNCTRAHIDHTAFGGYVYQCDFNRRTSLCEIADQIASDRRFDKQCMKNAKQRDMDNGRK